jgi:chitinase
MDGEQVSCEPSTSYALLTITNYVRYFSNAVATQKSRATFASNILAAYKAFDLDGIDIDWEYPGRQGAPGNKWHPNDAKNFLSFIRLLRTVLPPEARISAAVDTTTFIGNNGKAMSNVSEFSKVLDWALIMNYDVWGSK